MAKYLAGICIFIILSSFFQKVKRKSFILFQAIPVFLFLLSGEKLILQWLMEKIEHHYLRLIITIFDILWWIIPAFFLLLAIERFIWIPLEIRADRTIPSLARRFMAFSIWVLVFFGIIAFVFDQKITSLLATSGVIAMIIGLAIQINISNIFSGIAINLERPFRIGDWIQVSNLSEGRVIDITWRTTRIQTRTNNIISVPNSMASEAVIQNFNYPDDTYEIGIKVHVDPVHPPEQVEKILLDTILSAEEVQSAVVRFNFGEWSVEYSVFFNVRDYGKKTLYRHTVAKKIWTALDQADIVPVMHRKKVMEYKILD